MSFYIFFFISTLILTMIINAMLKHITAGIYFNENNISQISYGRVLDFKTKISSIQKTPIIKP